MSELRVVGFSLAFVVALFAVMIVSGLITVQDSLMAFGLGFVALLSTYFCMIFFLGMADRGNLNKAEEVN